MKSFLLNHNRNISSAATDKCYASIIEKPCQYRTKDLRLSKVWNGFHNRKPKTKPGISSGTQTMVRNQFFGFFHGKNIRGNKLR